jgi:thiol:disulfide interchange protein DsbA
MKKRFLISGFIVLLLVVLVTSMLVYRNLSAKKALAAEQSLALAAQTQVPTVFEEGMHYRRISKEITANKNIQDFIAEDPHKIQVIEFFNYGCFWCSRLHPILTAWTKKKPVNVVFYSVPVVFNKHWEALGKAFFMVKSLGKNDSLDPVFFQEIHQHHVDLSDEKLLKAFFKKQGISEQQFSDLFESFAVNSELVRAIALANAYQISLSPVIIINAPSGSYLLTAKDAGNEQALMALLNQLISEESKTTAKAGS